MVIQALLLTLAVWLTYSYSLKSGFVSDDLTGIAENDGKLKKITYGDISKWLRYHICGGNFPSEKIGHEGKPIPTGKVPFRHHALSITIYNLAIISTHLLLSQIIGVKLSFLSCLLFIVHPIGIQAVAWCSGIGYPLCLFWLTLSLNLALYLNNVPLSPWFLVLGYLLFGVIQFLCVNAMFAGMMSCVILAFLGFWWVAIYAGLVSILTCTPVVKWTIRHRKQQFKKQAMGESTHISWRKIIVATRTFIYYLGLVLWPRKLGLYHVWGYHYGPYLERDDKKFWQRFILVVLIASVFFLCPIMAVKFGILWFVAFMWIFLNWITIQQFIAERYAFIPTLGLCIVLAYLLQNYLAIYTLVLGMLLVRTWMHLPTYDDELKFYQSNIWNFQNSEVAYGNLGVTYTRMGRVGSAMDSWSIATSLNKEYDVPYYNLYSRYKSSGLQLFESNQFQGGIENLKIASGFLESAIKCKVCHFKKQWEKELVELKKWISDPMSLVINEFNSLKKRDNKLIKKARRIQNKITLGQIDTALVEIRKKLQYWGSHIERDINSLDKQLADIEKLLASPITDELKATQLENKKVLGDRAKLLRGILYGK